MSNTTLKHLKLRNLLLANANEVIDALIAGLIECGTEEEWDSGTIEGLLEPIQTVLAKLDVPPVSSTGEDMEALKFWCDVAGYPVPWDPFGGDRDDALSAWQEAVTEGETQLGLDEWWAQGIAAKKP